MKASITISKNGTTTLASIIIKEPSSWIATREYISMRVKGDRIYIEKGYMNTAGASKVQRAKTTVCIRYAGKEVVEMLSPLRGEYDLKYDSLGDRYYIDAIRLTEEAPKDKPYELPKVEKPKAEPKPKEEPEPKEEPVEVIPVTEIKPKDKKAAVEEAIREWLDEKLSLHQFREAGSILDILESVTEV